MEEMPELDMDILTVTLHRLSGQVEVDYQGMNYLEAIGVLTVALNQVQDTPYDNIYSGDIDDDEDL